MPTAADIRSAAGLIRAVILGAGPGDWRGCILIVRPAQEARP